MITAATAGLVAERPRTFLSRQRSARKADGNRPRVDIQFVGFTADVGFVELLVETITVSKENVEVRFRANGIEQVVEELKPMGVGSND